MKTETDIQIDVNRIMQIAIIAGRKIYELYCQKELIVDYKQDKSPVTVADMLSNEIINAGLRKYYPDIPVISEECKEISYDIRKDWQCFWLVDPLDGTKEFIKGYGEFTVNIALVKEFKPVLGVVYLPVSDVLYCGEKELGSFKLKDAEHNPDMDYAERIKVSPAKCENLIALKSRSHSTIEEEKYLSQYSIQCVKEAGSSLKFCLIAEGCADIYFRSGHTYEWDTAAGQAVLECAGGYVNCEGRDLKYNKKNLLNDSFVAVSSLSYLL